MPGLSSRAVEKTCIPPVITVDSARKPGVDELRLDGVPKYCWLRRKALPEASAVVGGTLVKKLKVMSSQGPPDDGVVNDWPKKNPVPEFGFVPAIFLHNHRGECMRRHEYSR